MNWVFSKMKPKSSNYKYDPKNTFFIEKLLYWVLMPNYLSEIYSYPQNSRI